MIYEARECAMCEKKFTPSTHRQKFCCKRCSIKFWNLKNREHLAHPNPNPITDGTKVAVRLGIRQGQTIAQIAKELDRPVEQIREIYIELTVRGDYDKQNPRTEIEVEEIENGQVQGLG